MSGLVLPAGSLGFPGKLPWCGESRGLCASPSGMRAPLSAAALSVDGLRASHAYTAVRVLRHSTPLCRQTGIPECSCCPRLLYGSVFRSEKFSIWVTLAQSFSIKHNTSCQALQILKEAVHRHEASAAACRSQARSQSSSLVAWPLLDSLCSCKRSKLYPLSAIPFSTMLFRGSSLRFSGVLDVAGSF